MFNIFTKFFGIFLANKIVTVFVLTAVVIGGTVAASYYTKTTTESVTIGSGPGVTAAKTTTTTVVSDNPNDKPVAVVVAAPEAVLAEGISRNLGISVTVNEIIILRGRNMNDGDISLLYCLVRSSGRSPDYILDMRYGQKMGWGKIAKVLGVKLRDSADTSVIILRGINLDSFADNFMLSIRIDLDDDDKEWKGKEQHFNEGKKQHSDEGNKNHKNDNHDNSNQEHKKGKNN